MANRMIQVVGTLMMLASLAQIPTKAAEPAELFVKNLVTAINSGDAERRKAMLHPKTLVCANTAPDLFFDAMLARQAQRQIPQNYKWNMTAVPPGQSPMFADKFDYPVRPTHLLQIDFEPEPNSSTTIVLQLVHESNQWHEITACPRPETVAAARAVRQDRAKYAERVKTLVATIPAGLKATVVKLYRDGRKIDAYKHYQTATGEDLAISRDVVQMLVAPTP